MKSDIVNAPALHQAIERIVEGAPLTLQAHRPALRAALRSAVEGHPGVRRARRRRTDPEWAQVKFANGIPLWRFHEDHGFEEDFEELLAALSQVGAIAAEGEGLSGEAAAFLRGLPHRTLSERHLRIEANNLTERHAVARLWTRRDEPMRAPMRIEDEGAVAVRCATISEIIRLSREARNCLKEEKHWTAFARKEVDVWSVRAKGRLLAVLRADRVGQVTEIRAPSNATVPVADVQAVARLCVRAGLDLSGCKGDVLPAFAEAPRLVRWVRVKDRVAVYAEWPGAVRIDLGFDTRGWPLLNIGQTSDPSRTLALGFDITVPCGAEVLGEDGLGSAVRRFGRKWVRRVVGAVALEETAPSLVQHRLLALAA